MALNLNFLCIAISLILNFAILFNSKTMIGAVCGFTISSLFLILFLSLTISDIFLLKIIFGVFAFYFLAIIFLLISQPEILPRGLKKNAKIKIELPSLTMILLVVTIALVLFLSISGAIFWR